jgi:serine/threonine protein kinase/formylglycine-generating enzyme required for sulfatase activity
MTEEALYTQFVERFFDDGSKEVPKEWSDDLRKRCLLFLHLMETSREANMTLSVSSSLTALPPSSSAAPQPGRASETGDSDEINAGERYVVEKEIARGGMGCILLAYDRDLRRRIALKVVRATDLDHSEAQRFVEEAQATAQLEHPNIGPVYDLGQDANGFHFFTMKWIRGRDLGAVLASEDEEYTLTRLIQMLQQAAMGVHFANNRGVIHRDLKPQNIMIGDYGEVLVVDWGLAKILRAHDAPDEMDAELDVSTERTEEGFLTIDGAVQGSLPYMAPEQAHGRISQIDARTDVFGLGAILYEILTGCPPYLGSSIQELLRMAREADVIPPGVRSPDRGVPQTLEEICLRALARRPEDRYADGRSVYDALQTYIEGLHDAERRAAEVLRLRAVADGHQAAFADEKRQLSDLESRLKSVDETTEPHALEADKRPLWDLLEEVTAQQEAVTKAFDRTAAAYQAVLSIEAEHRPSRDALAALYMSRLLEAEESGDAKTAELYRGLVHQFPSTPAVALLSEPGRVRLESDPPSATVRCCRYEERGLRLVETNWQDLGRCPLAKKLPRGSYLAVFESPGCETTRYPFWIERGEEHHQTVRLLPEGCLPEGFVHIPSGDSIIGTTLTVDPVVPPRMRVHVQDFVIALFPVTFDSYCEFLNDRFPPNPEDPDDNSDTLKELLPAFSRDPYVQRRAGEFVPRAEILPGTPVVALMKTAAEAYCEWLADRLSCPVRLLKEDEWERAARGADGRVFPWGNGFDFGFCKGLFSRSRDSKPFPEPVGKFSQDSSPFGVRDLAGGVSELCQGEIRKGQDGHYPLRGGSWIMGSPIAFRSEWRFMQREMGRATDAGFRVGFDVTQDVQ